MHAALRYGALFLFVAFVGACSTSTVQDAARVSGAASPVLPALFDDIERRTFNYFWETTNPDNGLVPDRYPNPPFSSIAAVGFGLTAYPIGVERGFITRGQARQRVLATLRFFNTAPQGPQPAGASGHKGFFYHFLDMKTGTRSGTAELSTVDTSLLLAGMLYCQSYFDENDADEAEIRHLVEDIYGRVDWRWAQNHAPLISMGWNPNSGFIPFDWRGYNEAMLVYILALGSPTNPVARNAWSSWTDSYYHSYGTYQGQKHLGFAPLFGHQYSHVWIDFRGIQDKFMRGLGFDYFENSRRATYAQRSYAISNPARWKGYGENVWGLTASDGPGDLRLADYAGNKRQFKHYFARGAGIVNTFDDGTIAPTAASASLPFAPEIVIPAVQEMHRRYGGTIYGAYGFFDAFNVSFVDASAALSNGRVVQGFGWVDTDYLGIDQGPLLAMIANYRSELVWRMMRKNPHVRRGLERAGFSGGWLATQAP
jgi:hypothetical protein